MRRDPEVLEMGEHALDQVALAINRFAVGIGWLRLAVDGMTVLAPSSARSFRKLLAS